MPSFQRGISKLLPNIVILGGIGGLGAWGHATHWSLTAHEATHAVASHRYEDAEGVDAAALPVDGEVNPDKAPVPVPGPEQPHVGAHDVPLAAADANAAQPAVQPGDRVDFPSEASAVKWGIQTVEVATRPMDTEITTNAVVTYDQTRLARLATRVRGTVWRVERRLGQWVEQGDVLALVESVDVGRAKAEFLEAVAWVNYNAKTVERLKSLQANVVSGRQVLEAESELRRSRVRLFNAQQALVNLGLPIHQDEFQSLDEAELVRLVRFLGLPEATRSQLDPEATTANLIPVTAPFAGVVIGRDVAIGEVVSPEEPQFVVADVQRMWIHLNVRQEDAGRIALGQTVTFTAEGLPAVIECQATWISTEVDERTRTVEVRAECDNPLVAGASGGAQRLVRANTFGSGKIKIRQRDQALVVPNQSIQWDGEQHVVFVRSGAGQFALRPVQLGTVGTRETEIVSGLSMGEEVVSVGSHLLKSEIVRLKMAQGDNLASAK